MAHMTVPGEGFTMLNSGPEEAISGECDTNCGRRPIEWANIIWPDSLLLLLLPPLTWHGVLSRPGTMPVEAADAVAGGSDSDGGAPVVMPPWSLLQDGRKLGAGP
jgi:hypothetical protein